jgi:hypothetical protein
MILKNENPFKKLRLPLPFVKRILENSSLTLHKYVLYFKLNLSRKT